MRLLKWTTFGILLLSIPLLGATPAFAAEHASEAEQTSMLILLLINFAVFVALLCTGYKKKVQPRMLARSVEIRTALNRVVEMEEKEEREVAELRDSLDSLDEEEAELLAAFQQEGMRTADAIRMQAMEEVHQIEKDTEQLKENLLQQLQSEVREEMSALALKKAQERIKQNFTPDMDRNLRREVIQSFNQ